MFAFRWLVLSTVFFLCLGCTRQESNFVSIGRDPTWYPFDLGPATININAFTNALIQAINKAEHLHLHVLKKTGKTLPYI